jgi:hypothetical protein
MQVSFVTDPTPHVLLENIFSEEELELIWHELEALTPSLDTPKMTGSAFYEDEQKTLKKNNRGLFLHEVYYRHSVSPIIHFSEKKLFNEIYEQFNENHWFYKTWRSCNWDTTLLSYYENSNYYEKHRDTCVFTALFWLWKEPKKFEGGNLTLTEHNYNIECKNNCGIVFPGAEEHAVSEVKLPEEFANKNLGRYVISVFFGVGGPT